MKVAHVQWERQKVQEKGKTLEKGVVGWHKREGDLLWRRLKRERLRSGESWREGYKQGMNSYFANPSLSCHLSGGQDVLPNVPINSTTYDTVRHFSSYGAAVTQNRIYAPFYSPQENVVFGSGRAQYEYGSNVFLQDKDVLPSCRQTNMGLSTQSHIAQEYSLDQGRAGAQEQKSNIPIYPWMQRMNSHSGEFYYDK